MRQLPLTFRDQLGFGNVREYVLCRDAHVCQHCYGRSKDKILNVHHLESRKTGGDAPNNLITLCETCHKAFHAEELKLNVKRGKPFKAEAFMGIMRWTLLDRVHQAHCFGLFWRENVEWQEVVTRYLCQKTDDSRKEKDFFN